MKFRPFPKIARLNREIVITEKIDGTNASIYIGEDGAFLAGSRTKWLSVEDDNFGFARWALDNKEDLLNLGAGHHFGEWWGKGIQRGYGLTERRFSLFNVSRWADDELRPNCCHVVPVLYQGMFSESAIEKSLCTLRLYGSSAVQGFMKPEGIAVYHTAANTLFKVTLEKDEKPKGGGV